MFPSKSILLWKKSAAKFLCVKTFSGDVVRHSLAYLAVHEWLLGDAPLNANFVRQANHPLVRQPSASTL